MSKTIEEILLPKPAARPGIYAYAIADKAHTGLLEAGQTPRGVKQRFWNVLSGLAWIFDTNSRALPWAIVVCPFGANHHLRRTKGASCVSPGQRLGTPPAPTARPNTSPGQRPGYPNHKTHPALKGRPNICRNPSPVSTFTSSSAPKTANAFSPTPCAVRCMPMATVLQNLGCAPVLINSVEDHVHILFELARTVSVSQAVEDVKKSSSRWIKTQGQEFAEFAWQAGYGAFAVSESNIETVRHYIAGQREHHRVKSFQEEYRQFLERHRITFDERYVWD